MTDDICGYQDTAGDQPCQNPATEGTSCWIEAHGGDVGGHGRPSKLEDTWDEVMAAAERGLTMEGIARAAGIGVSTLRDWRSQYEDFSAELSRARARAEQDLIRDAGAEFVLERSYGYTKEQEIELSGEVDTSLTPEDKELLDDLFDRDPQ